MEKKSQRPSAASVAAVEDTQPQPVESDTPPSVEDTSPQPVENNTSPQPVESDTPPSEVVVRQTIADEFRAELQKNYDKPTARAPRDMWGQLDGAYGGTFHQLNGAVDAWLRRHHDGYSSQSDARCPIVDYLLDTRLHERGLAKAPSEATREEAVDKLAALHTVDVYGSLLHTLIPSEIREDVDWYTQSARYAANSSVTAASEWGVYLHNLQTRSESLERTGGLHTGIATVDQNLGGLSGVTILAGPPGVGKSTLALQIAQESLRTDPRLGLLSFTIDMPREVSYDRLIAKAMGISHRELLREEKNNKFLAAMTDANEHLSRELKRMGFIEKLAFEPTHCDGNGVPQRLTPQECADEILRHRKELAIASNLETVLIVIDLFQNMGRNLGSEGIELDKTRIEILKHVQEATKSAKNPYGDPILLVSEVRKDCFHDQLVCTDVMGSMHLVSTASTVLLMSTDRNEDNVQEGHSPIILNVGKARDGAVRGEHRLWFDYEHYVFNPRSASPQQRAKTSHAPTAKAKFNPAAKPQRKAAK